MLALNVCPDRAIVTAGVAARLAVDPALILKTFCAWALPAVMAAARFCRERVKIIDSNPCCPDKTKHAQGGDHRDIAAPVVTKPVPKYRDDLTLHGFGLVSLPKTAVTGFSFQ
jgi:hypothetical protein